MTADFSLFVRASATRRSIFAMPPKCKRAKLTFKKGERKKAELKRQSLAELTGSETVLPATLESKQVAEDTVTGKN